MSKQKEEDVGLLCDIIKNYFLMLFGVLEESRVLCKRYRMGY
jgi:hypothetical protein